MKCNQCLLGSVRFLEGTIVGCQGRSFISYWSSILEDLIPGYGELVGPSQVTKQGVCHEWIVLDSTKY